MVTQHISLTAEDLATAKALAKAADRPLSSFIRELIRDRAKASSNDR